MTTEELKSKILEKCEVILNDNPTPAKLAKTYGELTQRDWVESMCKSVNPTWNSCTVDPIPEIQNEQENQPLTKRPQELAFYLLFLIRKYFQSLVLQKMV